MFIQTVEKASFTPLSTAYLMSYLRANPEDEALVKKIALRAQAAFTKFTNGNHVTQTTFDVYFDPEEYYNTSTLDMPHRPIISVDSIIYFKEDNTEVTIDSSKYVVTPGGNKIFKKDLWKFDDSRLISSLRVRYTVGRNENTVEDDLLAGLEQYCLYLYENRGDTEMMFPDSVAQLWAPYVVYRL